MNPTQRKATSEDKLEKGNNSEAFLSASFKGSVIDCARDCINVEKIENLDNAWRWIYENIGMVGDVTVDENCGYHSYIGAFNDTRRTLGINQTVYFEYAKGFEAVMP